MLGNFTLDPKGKILNDVSAYQPPQAVVDITMECRDDVQTGDEIQNRPFNEFNGVSMIDRMNEDQRNWLGWNPGPSDDPEEDWRATSIRPITRNKIISTTAHVTQNLIAPAVFAQNDQDEEDRTAGYIMGDLMEYNIRRSHYEQAFLYGVVSGLVNPVSYFEVKYCQAYQHIWDGEEQQKVVDDEMSGFQYDLTRPEEILFDNPYQFFLQKQGFVARRRRISHSEAQGIHGEHENWQYVQEGVKAILGDDALFYSVEDIEDGLVEEVVWMRRQDDKQVPFVNGIYLGNPNTNYNPFYHRTNKNKPKYPWVKFGAEPIDAMKFFGYKSLAAKMANDQEMVDTLWQLFVDASTLSTMNPVVTIGAGKIDKSVYVPATVTDLPQNASVVPLNNTFNPTAAYNALQEAMRSASESAVDPQIEGKNGGMPQTARQSILLQNNAEINLGLIGRMVGTMVKEVGELMIDDIIRFQTIGEVMEIIGEVPRMKYRTFLVDNKIKDGTKKTHVIKFTDRLKGMKMSESEMEYEIMKMKDEAGEEREISEVNPPLFARMNFLCSVDYQQMFIRNTPMERAFKLEVYDKAIANPLIAQDNESMNAITRDFLLEPLTKGDANKYLPKSLEALIPQAGESQNGKQNISSQLMKSVAKEKAMV